MSTTPEKECIYYVRAPYPWANVKELSDFDDPSIIKGDSLHALYKLLDRAGVVLTQEENMITCGTLVIEIFDEENEQHLLPIVFEWYFKDSERTENFLNSQEGD